jgi:hypothetical protein
MSPLIFPHNDWEDIKKAITTGTCVAIFHVNDCEAERFLSRYAPSK